MGDLDNLLIGEKYLLASAALDKINKGTFDSNKKIPDGKSDILLGTCYELGDIYYYSGLHKEEMSHTFDEGKLAIYNLHKSEGHNGIYLIDDNIVQLITDDDYKVYKCVDYYLIKNTKNLDLGDDTIEADGIIAVGNEFIDNHNFIIRKYGLFLDNKGKAVYLDCTGIEGLVVRNCTGFNICISDSNNAEIDVVKSCAFGDIISNKTLSFRNCNNTVVKCSEAGGAIGDITFVNCDCQVHTKKSNGNIHILEGCKILIKNEDSSRTTKVCSKFGEIEVMPNLSKFIDTIN